MAMSSLAGKADPKEIPEILAARFCPTRSNTFGRGHVISRVLDSR
jgi:hypothetical protein